MQFFLQSIRGRAGNGVCYAFAVYACNGTNPQKIYDHVCKSYNALRDSERVLIAFEPAVNNVFPHEIPRLGAVLAPPLSDREHTL